MKRYEDMTPAERREAGLKFVGSANAASAQEACAICGGTIAIATEKHAFVYLVFVEDGASR